MFLLKQSKVIRKSYILRNQNNDFVFLREGKDGGKLCQLKL